MNLAIDGDTGTEKREMRVNIMNEGDGGWEKTRKSRSRLRACCESTREGRGTSTHTCEPPVSRRGKEEERVYTRLDEPYIRNLDKGTKAPRGGAMRDVSPPLSVNSDNQTPSHP